MNQPTKPTSSRSCPICGKPAHQSVLPFCSKRCADIDLNRWLGGVYVVAARDDDEEDESAAVQRFTKG